MFNLDKLLNNKNIKKIQNKSNIDYHYLKTIVLVLGFLFMLYQLYDKNESLNLIKTQYDSNIEQITKLNSDIKTNKKKLKEFTDKISTLNRLFVKDKNEFGLYKLMEYLDEQVKLYNFKYSTNQKETNLTKEYFIKEFELEKQNIVCINNILDIEESKKELLSLLEV